MALCVGQERVASSQVHDSDQVRHDDRLQDTPILPCGKCEHELSHPIHLMPVMGELACPTSGFLMKGNSCSIWAIFEIFITTSIWS